MANNRKIFILDSLGKKLDFTMGTDSPLPNIGVPTDAPGQSANFAGQERCPYPGPLITPKISVSKEEVTAMIAAALRRYEEEHPQELPSWFSGVDQTLDFHDGALIDITRRLAKLETKQQQDHENEAAVTADLLRKLNFYVQAFSNKLTAFQKDLYGDYKKRFNLADINIASLREALNRLIDHVNREIGVAQDVPLHERYDLWHAQAAGCVTALQVRVASLETTPDCFVEPDGTRWYDTSPLNIEPQDNVACDQQAAQECRCNPTGPCYCGVNQPQAAPETIHTPVSDARQFQVGVTYRVTSVDHLNNSVFLQEEK